MLESFSLLGLIAASVSLVGGNVLTLITVNFWFQTFPSNVSPQLAILVVTNAFYFVGFLLLLGLVVGKCGFKEVYRIFCIGGARRKLPMLALIGAFDVVTNFLMLYATPHTPEVLQALFQCSIPFFTLIQTVLFIPSERQRNYKSISLAVSFLFLTAGIVLGSWRTIRGGVQVPSGVTGYWIGIFAFSCVTNATWSVLQRIYLLYGQSTPSGAVLEEEEHGSVQAYLFGSESSSGSSRRNEEKSAFDQQHVQKLIMIVGDTGFQLLLTFLLLPLDAVPGFGNSATVHDTVWKVCEGINAIFASNLSILYGSLYAVGYFVPYLGEAHLNYFSPAFATIVAQLSSPLSAIILVAVPQWNVDSTSTTDVTATWCRQTGALALLLLSTFLYHRFEAKS